MTNVEVIGKWPPKEKPTPAEIAAAAKLGMTPEKVALVMETVKTMTEEHWSRQLSDAELSARVAIHRNSGTHCACGRVWPCSTLGTQQDYVLVDGEGQ
jgi:hypothetical protein